MRVPVFGQDYHETLLVASNGANFVEPRNVRLLGAAVEVVLLLSRGGLQLHHIHLEGPKKKYCIGGWEGGICICICVSK